MSAPPSALDSVQAEALTEQWRAAWPAALAVWSRFTRLRDARLCHSSVEAAREGLHGSFAMIRLLDQSVVIDLETVTRLGLQDYAVEILAHEIGHHVLAPCSATDHFRLLARMRKALPTLERQAPMVANLYTDLFINDRLQRQAGLRMADIYQRLEQDRMASQKAGPGSVWVLYMRIYEHLWKLPKGVLCGAANDEALNADAWLGARLIRVYAGEWMFGAGRFATLLLPYLVESSQADQTIGYMADTRDAAEGCEPYGAQTVEADEIDGAIHPVHDRALSGQDDEAVPTPPATAQGAGQTREPFEFGEILKAAGIKLSDHEIAVRYYRERALPHLVDFPVRRAPESPEPQLEGLEPWQVGEPIDQIDWLQSLINSPVPIPGLTTVQRVMGQESGFVQQPLLVDLDMYVDSSGSMPNPQYHTSYLALAGAIIALSALRAGSSVQVTLWSGTKQVTHTRGFVRDEDAILRVLTGFFGGATAFPIRRLRDTYCGALARARPTHILMISDDGITTMFDQDEKGNSGWDVAAKAMAAAGAGGTMALQIDPAWDTDPVPSWRREMAQALLRARGEQGWQIDAIVEFEDLLAFARAFSQRHYAPAPAVAGATPRTR